MINFKASVCYVSDVLVLDFISDKDFFFKLIYFNYTKYSKKYQSQFII